MTDVLLALSASFGAISIVLWIVAGFIALHMVRVGRDS